MDLETQSPKLLNFLTNLNKVGARVNQISSGDKASIAAILNLIVESAIQVVPETSAVIYTFNQEKKRFDPDSRFSAGEKTMPLVGDTPRASGLGMTAINQGVRILSNNPQSPPIHPVSAASGAKIVACFPLTVAKENVGALYIYNHSNHPFTEFELLLLENFVFQAAMAIYHARQMSRIQNDLEKREEETLQLQRAGLLISSHPNLDETLETILKMALEVTDAQYGNCLLVSQNGKELEIAATVGERLSRPNTKNIPINSNSVTGWVARNREPIMIADLKEKPWADKYVNFDVDLEMRSELAVPLISASGRLEGVINLESLSPNAFAERDFYVLQGLATHAVITIQDILLLDAIKSITQKLLTQPYHDVLQALITQGLDLLNADASAIWVLDDKKLILQAANFDHYHGEHVPLQNSLAGEAILKRKPVISENVQTDARFHRSDLAKHQDWEKAVVVPLFVNHDQAPVGALSVYSKIEESSGRFAESDWDMKVLTILADYVALAVVGEQRKESLDLVKAQHTAAETFAAVGDISANLMHQLNNKVGTIPVRVQGIEEKSQSVLENDPYLAENLKQIEKASREAMLQVRENLSLLKPIQIESVNLETCLQDAVTSITLPPDVIVKQSGFAHLPEIEASRHSLEFIFSNLIENAVKAMAGKGTITMNGSINERWVKIDISDTGSGIETEHLNKIFEYNFSESSSTPSKNLGFGLWWIKALITRLGGTISAKNDEAKGTVFKIRFPYKKDHINLESAN